VNSAKIVSYQKRYGRYDKINASTKTEKRTQYKWSTYVHMIMNA